MAPRRTEEQDQDHADHGHGEAARALAGEKRLAQADRADVTQRTYRGSAEPAPRRPDERDESADSQASPPRPVMARAHGDVVEGRVDTDQRSRSASDLMRRLREDDQQNTNSDGTEDGNGHDGQQ